MTGDEPDLSSVAAVLRVPALPSELEGEAAAVGMMVGIHGGLSTSAPARHARRALTIAAVTVASLGVGGLAAAGPGFFARRAVEPPRSAAPPASDAIRPVSDPTWPSDLADQAPSPTVPTTEGSATAQVDQAPPNIDEHRDPAVTHRVDGICLSDAIAEVLDDIPPGPDRGAQLPDRIAAAIAACSDRSPDETGSDDGATPAPSADAPGQSGETPGQSGETPGQSGDAPGRSEAPPTDTKPKPDDVGDGDQEPGDDPGDDPDDDPDDEADANADADADADANADAKGAGDNNGNAGGGNG